MAPPGAPPRTGPIPPPAVPTAPPASAKRANTHAARLATMARTSLRGVTDGATTSTPPPSTVIWTVLCRRGLRRISNSMVVAPKRTESRSAPDPPVTTRPATSPPVRGPLASPASRHPPGLGVITRTSHQPACSLTTRPSPPDRPPTHPLAARPATGPPARGPPGSLAASPAGQLHHPTSHRPTNSRPTARGPPGSLAASPAGQLHHPVGQFVQLLLGVGTCGPEPAFDVPAHLTLDLQVRLPVHNGPVAFHH